MTSLPPPEESLERIVSMRARTLTLLIGAALFLGFSASAVSAGQTTVRWTHPDSSEVTGFTVHVGYTARRYETGLTRTFASLQADQNGIYEVTIDIEPDRTIYLAIRAYNDTETSAYSNEGTRYDASPLGVPGRPRLRQN